MVYRQLILRINVPDDLNGDSTEEMLGRLAKRYNGSLTRTRFEARGNGWAYRLNRKTLVKRVPHAV
jgi:hypothetical protein